MADAATVAGLALLAAVVCLPVFASGDRWGFWDWDIFESALEAARASVVHYGQAPGWNPYVRGGENLAAHPLLPLASPSFLVVVAFGTIPGIKLWVFARLLVALIGAYLLGRRLGLGRLGALGVAVVFGLSSTYAQRVGHGHWNLQAFVYLPLLLHAGLDAVRPGRWRARGLAAIWLALLFLDGGPYTFALGWIALAALVAIGLARREAWSAVAGAAAVGALSFALAAPKAVPVAMAYGVDGRALPYGEGLILDFYDPDFAPTLGEFLHAALLEREQASRPGRFPSFHINVGAYVGVLGLSLAALGVAASPLGRAAALLAAPILWIALGSSAPWNVWALLHELPVARSMTVPAKFLPCVLLALAVAAGAGLDALERRAGGRRGRWAAGALLVVLAADLLWVSRPVYGHAFPIEPIPVERGRFHQVRVSPFEREYVERVTLPVGVRPFTSERRHSSSATLPAVLSNIGVLSTPSGSHITAVRAAPDLGGELTLHHASSVAGAEPRLLDWSPSVLRIEVDPARGGQLFVNQNFDPGWRARSGDRELATLAVKPGILGVDLPAGASEVTLRFRPPGRRAGTAIALLAAAAVAALIGRGGVVEPSGIEPPTSALRTRRSPS